MRGRISNPAGPQSLAPNSSNSLDNRRKENHEHKSNEVQIRKSSAKRQEEPQQGDKHGQEQGESPAAPQRASQNEHTFNRVAEGMGGCAPETAREGEGDDSRPGRVGRPASADAVGGRGQEVAVRRTRGQGR